MTSFMTSFATSAPRGVLREEQACRAFRYWMSCSRMGHACGHVQPLGVLRLGIGCDRGRVTGLNDLSSRRTPARWG